MGNIITSAERVCIKTGLIWTHNASDNAFTGDLNWRPITQDFEIRGVPVAQGALRHVYYGLKGPEPVDILVIDALITGREGTPWADVEIGRIVASEKFVVWLEEWSRNYDAVFAAHRDWQIKPDLHWVKS